MHIGKYASSERPPVQLVVFERSYELTKLDTLVRNSGPSAAVVAEILKLSRRFVMQTVVTFAHSVVP